MEKLHDHHINHYRSQHEANKDNKWIRRYGGLIVPMVLEVHDALHANCCGVPPLDIYMARRVKAMMIRGDTSNPLQAIDTFCAAVEEASAHPKTYPPEKMVGEAAIEAIRMQIPFILEGSPDARDWAKTRNGLTV